MSERAENYTRYPRPLLWLVQGEGEVESFYLGRFPVTNEQFEAFDPEFRRAAASPEDRSPAIGISREASIAYVEWYAAVSRKPMRLPTEAEWLHACRAASTTAYFWGEVAADGADSTWAAEDGCEVLPPLDQKRPNGFGLYGMLGGVPERVGDGSLLCGGSWRLPRAESTCGWRTREDLPEAGFRIAKSLR